MAPRTRAATRDLMAAAALAKPTMPRPLKRSASTASLPTPPRTRRNPRTRSSMSRGSIESDTASENEDEEDVTQDRKRQKLEASKEEEEAFWMGGDEKSTGKSTAPKTVVEPRSPSPEPSEHLIKRAQSKHSSGLASPPPSRRHNAAPSQHLVLPVTPKRHYTRSQKSSAQSSVWPIRNSPENLFLDSGFGGSPIGGEYEELELGNDVSPTPAEKPTVTYVFRGKRAVFANPHYHPPDESPTIKAKREEKHKLPLEHPDYSPESYCPPKRLFTRKRTKKVEEPASPSSGSKPRKSAMKSRLLAPVSEDEEEDEDPFAISDGLKGVAKRLFVDGAGKGSVDAGMVEIELDMLVKRGAAKEEDDIGSKASRKR